MHIVIGGCGQLGADIATRLSRESHNDVVVLDVNPRAFDRLGTAFNGETLNGDTADRKALELAGISRADAFLAVTRFDNVNLMSVQIASHLYDVQYAVARLFNPERESIYRKLGVRYVSGTALLTQLFLNEFDDLALPSHIDLPDTSYRVVDLELGPKAEGMCVEDLEVDGELRVCVVSRAGETFIPAARDRLHSGDLVTAGIYKTVGKQIASLLKVGA